MNKKIITIIWLLIPIFIFTGCTGGGFKTRSCTELTNEDMEEIQKLEITEDYKAVRLYNVQATLLFTVAYFDTFDKLISELEPKYYFTYLLVFDEEKHLINNKDKIFWEDLYDAIFEPEIYLDDIIKGNYTIKRILCNDCDIPQTSEKVIYYETTKGNYVFLYIPEHYDSGGNYLIPWDVVEEKAEVALDDVEENGISIGYTPFYDAKKYFSDYKLNQ